MTRLVEDLLFLARSDAGSVPLELEWVNIEPFLTELVDRAGVLARQHDSLFRRELAAVGRVRIDRSRIEQVVLILAGNAAKYNSAGKPVTLRSATRGAELVVEVADQGPGIAAPDLPWCSGASTALTKPAHASKAEPASAWPAPSASSRRTVDGLGWKAC